MDMLHSCQRTHALLRVDLRSREIVPNLSASVYPLQGRVLVGSVNNCPSHGLVTTARERETDVNNPAKISQKGEGWLHPGDSRLKTNKQTKGKHAQQDIITLSS